MCIYIYIYIYREYIRADIIAEAAARRGPLRGGAEPGRGRAVRSRARAAAPAGGYC